ncbi:MAG: hypothetical protein AB7G39_00465 [Alphaproteobacteria bacterium]
MNGSNDLLWVLPLLAVGLALALMRRRRRRTGMRGRLRGNESPAEDQPVTATDLQRARRLFLLTFLALVLIVIVSVLSTLQHR